MAAYFMLQMIPHALKVLFPTFPIWSYQDTESDPRKRALLEKWAAEGFDPTDMESLEPKNPQVDELIDMVETVHDGQGRAKQAAAKPNQSQRGKEKPNKATARLVHNTEGESPKGLEQPPSITLLHNVTMDPNCNTGATREEDPSTQASSSIGNPTSDPTRDPSREVETEKQGTCLHQDEVEIILATEKHTGSLPGGETTNMIDKPSGLYRDRIAKGKSALRLNFKDKNSRKLASGSSNASSSLTIHININGTTLEALADTGAALSSIPYNLIEACGVTSTPRTAKGIRVISCDDTEVKVKGF